MIIKSEDSFPWHTLYISYNSILWLIYDTYHPQARDRNSTYGEATINSVGITDYNPYYDSWKVLLFYQNAWKCLLRNLLLVLLVSLSESGLLQRLKNIVMRLLVFDILWYFSFDIRFPPKIAEGKVMIPAVYEPSASDIGDFPISTHSAIFWLKYLVKV